MPLVKCPDCGATYKVPLERIGRELRCRHCPTTFIAETRRSTPRVKTASFPARLIIYGFILIAAIVVGLITLTRTPTDGDGSLATAKRSAGLAESLDAEGVATVGEAAPLPATSSPALSASADAGGSLLEPVRTLLSGIEARDAEQLQQMINFAAFWANDPASRSDARSWAELPDWQQMNKRREYVDALLAEDEAAAPFVDRAALDSLAPPNGTDRSGPLVAKITLRDPQTGDYQDRTVAFVQVAGRWFLTRHETGPIRNPEAEERVRLDAERKARLADLGITTTRRHTDEAPIEQQAELEQTTAMQRSEVSRAIRTLLDLSKTREATGARRALVRIGRPAIVGLLNAIVPLDLGDRDDLMRANRCVQTLQEMTEENFGFLPMGIDGRLDADVVNANTTAIRRWFGWWRDNARSWKPIERKAEEPTNRRRRRRNGSVR